MTLRVWIVALALIGTCALAACGRQASLDRPGPLTGRAPGTHVGPERTERDKAAARARADAAGKADPIPPQSIDDVRNMRLPKAATQDGVPASEAPAAGQPAPPQP